MGPAPTAEPGARADGGEQDILGQEESAPRAGMREWVGLAVLALPTLLVSLDMFVMLLALPHVSSDLHAGSVHQLWIMDVYGFMVAGFMITMGTLGDRIGRRRLLLAGSAAFGVASLAAAWSTSAPMLIGFRGSVSPTVFPAILVNRFQRREAARLLSQGDNVPHDGT